MTDLELAQAAAARHGFDPAIVRMTDDGRLVVDLADVTLEDLWRPPAPPPVPEPTAVERLAVRLARRSHRAAMLILGTPILGRALRRHAELEYRRAVRDHLADDA